VSDLRSVFTPELVVALERLIDERVAVALDDLQANGASTSSPWLSLSEAARYMRVSERKVQRLVRDGRIRSTTLGRRRLFHRDDLDELVKATTGEDVAPTTSPRRRAE
jgi:excisionase family DNA binding protein